MKKTGLFLGLILISGIAKASWWDDRPDQYTVTFSSAAGASISTTVIMVPLASTTTASVTNAWPHPMNGRAIIVDSIQIDNDKTAATTSIIKVGVIREINASSGTIVWFERMGNGINVSNTNNFQYLVYPDGGLNCRVNPMSPNFGPNLGTTPYILSNDTLTASAINTSDLFVSPANGTPQTYARVGDIVANIVNSAVAANFVISIRYHIETQ